MKNSIGINVDSNGNGTSKTFGVGPYSILKEEEVFVSALFAGQGNDPMVELLASFEEEGESSDFFVTLFKTIDNCMDLVRKDGDTTYFSKGFALKEWMLDPTLIPTETILKSSYYSGPLIFAAQASHLYRFIKEGQWNLLRKSIGGIYGHSQGIFAGLLFSSSPNKEIFLDNFEKTFSALFFLLYRSQQVFPELDIDPNTLRLYVKKREKPSPMAQIIFNDGDVEITEILNEFNKNQSKSEEVHIGLMNTPNSKVFCGSPESLLKFRDELTQSGVDAVKTWNFITSSTAFHSPLLESVVNLVQTDFKKVGFAPKTNEIEIPLYDTRDGSDLRDSKKDLKTDLVAMVCTDQLNWELTLSSLLKKDGKHILLSFGPGEFIEKITKRFLRDKSYLIQNLTHKSRFIQFAKTNNFEFPKAWKNYAPELVNLPNGKKFVKNKYSLWTGRPPVFGGGMTPSTVEADIVIAAAKEGYIVELAGGGQVSEGIFRSRVEKITKELPLGKGFVINLLYLDPYLWNLHIPLIKKFKLEGAPIEGITISAGIPELKEAVTLLREWEKIGIWLNSFKPGTIDQIKRILSIADELPNYNILMQIEGGAAGGHHSWEDLNTLVSKTYEDIRKRSNIILAVGGGIASPNDAKLWLSGDWNQNTKMPVDAVFLGTRLMAALECKTSLPIKEKLKEMIGGNDWMKSKDGNEVGGIISGKSSLGADIYYASNTWTKLSELVEGLTKGKDPVFARESIAEKKAEIISLLNSTAKPYFGDLSNLSYTEVLERFLFLTCPGDRLLPSEGKWPDHPYIDKSYRVRLEQLVLKFEGRLIDSDTKLSILNNDSVLDDPYEFLKIWKNLFPNGQFTILLPEDQDFFLEVCKQPGKPVNFIPLLDENLLRWIKSDSLWYSHCVGMDPDRCAWIPGPLAIQGIKKINEPVVSIFYEFISELGDKDSPTKNIEWSEFTKITNPLTQENRIQIEHNDSVTEFCIPTSEEITGSDWVKYLSHQGGGFLSILLASNRIYGGVADQDMWFSPNESKKFTIEKGAIGELIQIRSFSHDGKFINVSLDLINQNTAELSLYFQHPKEQNQIPFKRRFLFGGGPETLVIEDQIFANEEMRKFYANVWDIKSVPNVILDFHSFERMRTFEKEWFTEYKVTEENIIEFRKTTKDLFRRDLIDSNKKLSPISMGVVFSWESTVLPLLSYSSADLFKLLHFSQEFHWKPEASLVAVEDVIKTKSKISRVKKLGESIILYVTGVMWNSENEIGAFETGFLLRNQNEKFIQFDTTPLEQSIEFFSQAEIDVFQQLIWINLNIKPDTLRVGDKIRFVTSERRIIANGSDTFHYIIGNIFQSNGQMNEVLLGSFKIDERRILNEDSSLDRFFKVFREAEGLVALPKKYRILSEVFTAPDSMFSYSKASKDANPIHTDIRFAKKAGWVSPIVHGLWTSSQVVNSLVRNVCEGDSSRIVSLKESFEAPVLLGEELRLTAFHIGQKSGNMALEITLENKNGETKLRAEALLKPLNTAYVFTGQGSQSQGMGMKLLEEFTEASDVWSLAERVATNELDFSLLEVVQNNPTSLHCGGKNWVHPKGVLNLTQFTQVALVAKSLADWAILKKRGFLNIESPFAGHSLGEFSALAAREFILPENVFKIVFNRGLNMQSLVARDEEGKSSYAMSVVLGNRHVGLNEEKILELVDEAKSESGLHLEVVNYNIRDKQYSVTGNIEALELLEEKCKKFVRGKKTTIRLEGIDVPFHSRILINGVDEFRKTLQSNIGSESPLTELDGRYIPNLIAKPFSLSDEFLHTILSKTGSPVAESLLKLSFNDRNTNESRRLVLIELLAFQFAMPVQWIETQETLFGPLATKRLIDIGARGDLAGMARQSLKERQDSSTFQILHIEENRNEVFYEKEDVPEAEWSEGPSVGKEDIEIPVAIQNQDKETLIENKPTLEIQKQNVINQIHSPVIKFSKKDALYSILALKANVRFDEIADSETIDDLLGGNSSKRNQTLADIGVEFKSTSLDGGHEKSLKDLVKLLEEQTSYHQPGPYLRAAFDESIKKFFPSDFGRKEIFQFLKDERMLDEEGVFLFSIYLPLFIRSGESLRNGNLSSIGLKNRLSNAAEVTKWLDQAVDLFANLKNVQIPRKKSESSHSAGSMVDSLALEALERKYFGIEGLFSKSISDLRRHLLDDDPYSEYLVKDLKTIEEARTLVSDDIQPIFSESKIVIFKNSKQWAKKYLLKQTAAFLRRDSKEFSKEDLVYLQNHNSKELCDHIVYWRSQFLERASKANLKSDSEYFKSVVLEYTKLLDNLSSQLNPNPVYQAPNTTLTPYLKVGLDGNFICEEKINQIDPEDFPNERLTLSGSDDFGSSFAENETVTNEFKEVLKTILKSGISFKNQKVLVTGAGPGSIAWEVVKAFLMGGADVVLTTTSYSTKRVKQFKELYQMYGAKTSRLEIVPFSQGSFEDIRSLVGYLKAKNWLPDFLIPFAAVGEENAASNLDQSSLVSVRVMLIGVQKLIGELGAQRKNQKESNSKLKVILPLSPNHGIFGKDGLYAETKLGLETLYRKKFSEANEWGNSVRILGAVIGWVRGTGLMGANDLSAPLLEAECNIKTYSRSEMGLLLTGYAAWSLRNETLEVVKADLTGGLGKVKNLVSTLSKIRTFLNSQTKQNIEVQSLKQKLSLETDSKKLTNVLPKHGLKFPEIPTEEDLSRYQTNRTTELKDLVCVVGYAEVGPFGGSMTRWELEKSGVLSLEACAELAWSLGYIQYQMGPNGKVWTDVKTGEPVLEWQIKEKYEDEILSSTGIRIVDQKTSPFDPTEISVYADVVLEDDLIFPIASKEEALEYKNADPEKTEIYFNPTSEKWTIKRKKGSVLKVKKSVGIKRRIAGQIPDGWNPERYGIPKDLIHQVDPITIYNLYCTCEAYLRAGMDPFELFDYIHPSQAGSSVGSGMGGMQKIKRMFLNFRLGEDRQHDALQESLINVAAAWAITSYAGLYGTVITPVAACATGGVSLEMARDNILSGKAKFMIAGAFDDTLEESMIGFGDMNATANSFEMENQGIEASEVSRPNDSRRNGFVEAQGGGILLLARGDVALEMGLPVYGILGFAGSRTDGIHTSIPAPGIGLLSLAADSNEESSPIQSALASFGLSGDDIGFAYKHDTSTKANDKNENNLLQKMMLKLKRTPGNNLPVVSQKYLTGHSKGGAAMWQSIGVLQTLEEGIISGNRNLTDVDTDMDPYTFITFTDEAIQFGKGHFKAGILTSLGFGHIAALCLFLHRNFFWVHLSPEEKVSYVNKCIERGRFAITRYHEIRLGNGTTLYKRKIQSFIPQEDEETALIDATYRKTTKNVTVGSVK
ncbi:type I polyketide synthase [Leptospira levettii]|uniref:type I polyketide synthase n=1 Tax=Leptospira levettii TaxID=2023178 RepID=UPI001FEED759|nr:type I polyketide synthase [Leptospira levettii]